ncbi:MAG: hypothetical protein FWH52_03230 [Synergistaceae bacterium]|nr:hypothetical protein [Synergistaceae bacterium]
MNNKNTLKGLAFSIVIFIIGMLLRAYDEIITPKYSIDNIGIVIISLSFVVMIFTCFLHIGVIETESVKKLLAIVVLKINDKQFKKVFFIIILPIFIVSSVVGTLTIIQNIEEQKREKMREDFEIQNFIFGLIVEQTEKNQDYNPVNIREPTIDGVSNGIYIALVLYTKETGNILAFDQVLDYLSQEFEDDGEIRIYTNGRHPEIAAYVEWAYQSANRRLRTNYGIKLSSIYINYKYSVKGSQLFPTCSFWLLPIEMVDELIKKEADPDYELDLMSIQNRYIEEGKARILDDETIEYIIPEQT